MEERGRGVEEAIRDAVEWVVPLIEGVAALFVVTGVVIALGLYLLAVTGVRAASYERVRLVLARFIALGLEFQLAADVMATAVAPSFEQIGRLAAVAGVRTLLNLFLAREIEHAERMEREGVLVPIRPPRGGPAPPA